jgi:cephalosporin-C deacetylase-like acetyl esterase/predicted Ser/Thr protein kinase
MICPKCHSDNPDTSRFCGSCAALLAEEGQLFDSLTKTLATPLHVISKDSLIAGKYRIIEEIGRGGMGVVYKAEDLKLKRMVALKFLPPHLMNLPELKERFIIEAQAAAALSHPNICVIHEVGETEDRSFIAMEYVEGETLRDKIKKGPLSGEAALDITSQIAAGLGEAHRKGIIHRDIKSANIMVTDKGQARVMDFGLAKLRDGSSLTKSQTTLGTVAYMSPEQARGDELDQRTDLWSLGVVLYEMLTGEVPFKGDRDVSIIYSIVHEEPKSLKLRKPPVPIELQQVIARALKKSREARYGSADEMFKDLRAYQTSLQLAGSGVLNLKTLGRRIRKPRVAVPTIAVLCALALLGTRFFRHQAQVRWARQVALPEMEKLIGENNAWRDLIPAYRLAEKAETYIPRDPKLAGIFSKCSLRIDIKTEPPGAKVFMKEYAAPASDWTYLGISPIEKTRLPIGIFRWKIEKEGYETVLAAASTWNVDMMKADIVGPYDLVRILDKKESIPPGMVRVTGAETPVGKLADFYIDKDEVTNKQYREFVNGGGYRNKKYWTQKFVKDGKELTWEDAAKGFVDQIGQPGPAAWQAGDFPEGQADYPVSGISWYEAAAYAEFAGKSLPTGYHWGIARGESTPMIQVPQLGGFAILAPFSNFLGKGPVSVGSLPGVTAYGAFDMAGNVREWCWNESPKGRVIRGGAWGENTYMFDNMSQAPAMDRSAENGFRCALYLEPEKIPGPVFQMVKSLGLSIAGKTESFAKQKPVPDSVFQVYKEQFSYDKTALKARVESKKESPEWTLEKISFEAAYGGERVMAYLFLPRNAAPPFQTVIYWGGDVPVFQRSSQDIESYYEVPMFFSFLVKNGRAVLYPVYKGFFERGNDALIPIIEGNWTSVQWKDVLIQQVKDLRRSIDYLETRPDIDGRKLAFEGMSYGSSLAPIILAVEERLKVNALMAGGFGIGGQGRPEVNQINYITRVKTPTLMLNGLYDSIFPPETSSKPMFDLLGTPAEHKQQKFYETDHIPPINEMIKETLAWLDKYLGPVKR